MTEALKDGPSVEPLDDWSYRHQRLQVERLLWQDDVLYALMRDREWAGIGRDPDLALIPVASLLREGRKEGHPYQETLRCRECGVEATGFETNLENAGWWVYGMGSGPLCPVHNKERSKRPEADDLAKKYPFLGRCHRCRMPTSGRKASEAPFLCGQCSHEIGDAAARRAVWGYLDRARKGSS